MTTHPDPEQLSAYIDGELNDDDRDDLEQHLTGCSECSATLRALRATLAVMRALPSPVPTQQQSWALRAAITKERKRPAQAYRRWMAAAGGVAAVAIAFVVFAATHTNNTRGASSTLAHGSRTADAASLIIVDPNNYNQGSAISLLGATGTAGPAVAAPLPTVAEGQTSGGGGTLKAGATATAAPYAQDQKSFASNRATYLTKIQGCERLVLPANSSNLTPQRYIVGTFEGTPVFFLIYSVAAAGETKFELWVVQRSDCYIRFFVPPR